MHVNASSLFHRAFRYACVGAVGQSEIAIHKFIWLMKFNEAENPRKFDYEALGTIGKSKKW